jgi:hypothetical protein
VRTPNGIDASVAVRPGNHHALTRQIRQSDRDELASSGLSKDGRIKMTHRLSVLLKRLAVVGVVSVASYGPATTLLAAGVTAAAPPNQTHTNESESVIDLNTF